MTREYSSKSLSSTPRDIVEIRRFIEGLELAEPRARKLSGARLDGPPLDSAPAAVDAGSQVSFVAGLAEQQKEDTLNSTLFAQLAANRAVSRVQDPTGWYDKYVTVLNTVGWVMQGFQFTQYEASGDTFDVNTAILDVLASIASADELAAATATLSALMATPSGDGATLWNTECHSATQGNFQISVASNDNGLVLMKLGVFYFNTTETVLQLLGFKFDSSSTTFFKDAEVVNLDESIYSQVRQAVIDKLGHKAQQFVVNLDI